MVATTSVWRNLGETIPAGRADSGVVSQMLNWQVEKRELFLANGNRVDGHYATCRSDTGAVLGVVGARYEILQNAEIFGFLDGLLADGAIQYESVFSIRGGSRVCVLARCPSSGEVAPGDCIKPYVMFYGSHDGSSAVVAGAILNRIACDNAIRAAIADNAATSLRIRHTASMMANLASAQRYLAQVDTACGCRRARAGVRARGGGRFPWLGAS